MKKKSSVEYTMESCTMPEVVQVENSWVLPDTAFLNINFIKETLNWKFSSSYPSPKS